MNWLSWTRGSLLALLTVGGLVLSGCGNSDTQPTQAKKEADGGNIQAVAAIDDSHGGWWCVEHGVPEEECALCDSSLVAKFKADGDWCKEHNRPESQCFICSSARFDKFAARYEAKVGRKPPKPEE